MVATLIQNSGAKSLSSTTNVHTWGTAPVVGNKLVIICANYPAPTVSVTDSAGNTYTKLSDIATVGDSRGTVWIATVGSVPTSTTVTSSVSSDQSCVFTEWNGLDIYDQQSTASNASAGGLTAFSSGTSPTLTQADELVIGLLAGTTGSSSSGITNPSGFTQLGVEQNSSAFLGMQACYKVVASTAGVSATWGFNALSPGATMTGTVVAIKITASGGTSLTPGAGSIALTGPAPTLAQTANQALSPAAGALTLTGPAPVISQSNILTPAAGSLTLTGQAPTLTQTANQSLTPGTGSLVLTGPAPTITQTGNKALTPGAGSLVLTGPAPTLTQTTGSSFSPASGSLVLIGPAPTLAQTTNYAGSPAPGALILTGFAPTVTQTQPQAPASSGVRRWLTQIYEKSIKARQEKALAEEIERISSGKIPEPKEPKPVVILTKEAALAERQRVNTSHERQFKQAMQDISATGMPEAVLSSKEALPSPDEQDEEDDHLLLASIL